VELARGQRTRLDAITPATVVELGVAVDVPGADVDVSVVGLDAAGTIADDRYVVFYNQPSSPEGAIRLVPGQPGERAAFAIDLAALPPTVERVVVTAAIDGTTTMGSATDGWWRMSAGGSEVARFPIRGADYGAELALIVGELYRKDGWRVVAVGQGFAGGLAALLRSFGADVADEPAAAAAGAGPAAAAPAAPAPAAPAPPVPAPDLRKPIDLKIEKEAPQLVSLVKSANISLTKSQLDGHRAKVAVCLDVSGSMDPLYRSGAVQRFAEKVLALGTRFDDDGAIDVFLFGTETFYAGGMGVSEVAGFVERAQQAFPHRRATYYGRAMQLIRAHFFPDAAGGERTQPLRQELPVYVMFLTDGGTADKPQTQAQARWSSLEPIFWQFMGLGKTNRQANVPKRKGFQPKPGVGQLEAGTSWAFLERLDDLDGRYLDNAGFFSLQDPEEVEDEVLYDLMLGEYPSWVRAARGAGLIP
jgi:stress response protein SCP2